MSDSTPISGIPNDIDMHSDKTALKRVNFSISAPDHRKLKIYAAKEGKTITDLLSSYIANLIKDIP